MPKKRKNINKISLGKAFLRKHICLFYGSKRDLLTLTVPYFKEGLENNEFCVWITSKPLSVSGAKKALGKAVKNLDKYVKKGQLEIMDYKDFYLKSGKFDPDRVLENLAKKDKEVLKQGFNGIRISGDNSWLRKKDWKKWIDYENRVDNMLTKHKITALCTYPLGKHDLSDIFIASMNHRFAFSNKGNRWHIIKNEKLNNLLYNIRYFLEDYKRKS